MNTRAALLAALALLCTACGGGKATRAQDSQTAEAAARPLLIDSRGVVMPLADAVKAVRFVPFVPSAQIVSVAVIPPLSDAAGHRARPGLAIEYASRGDALLLSQWPRDGLKLSVGATSITSRPCAPVAYKADGLLWATRDGRVMTVQPDGTVSASHIAQEAARLLRAGACGQARTRTLSRPLPSGRSQRKAVSSPRRSAS